MEYYIASSQGPLGPYSIEQLKARRLKPDELVWRNELPEWTRADALEELAEVLNQPVLPPRFDRTIYQAQIGNDIPESTPQQPLVDPGEMPPTYRWLAIIAFLGITPCAIVAIIKSVMVAKLWQGNYDGSRRQSKQVLLWSIIGLAIGLPLSIYYYLTLGDLEGIEDLIDLF